MRIIFKYISILILFVISGTNLTFSDISYRGKMIFTGIDGVSDARIRSIIQLPDGRMAFITISGTEIFNGSNFTSLYNVTGDNYNLKGYNGHHHLYITHAGRYLWIKNDHTLQCIDLDTEIYSTDIPSLLREIGFEKQIDDFFADTSGNVWVISDNILYQPDSGFSINLDKSKGNLLDLMTNEDNLYLFYEYGDVACYDRKTGKKSYSIVSSLQKEKYKFSTTSLVVPSGQVFYQIRNGSNGGFFLFIPQSRNFKKILEQNIRFNTLAANKDIIMITTPDGLMLIDPLTFQVSTQSSLSTRTGNLIASELSTIAIDREGGVWIGTLNRGIFYYSPGRYRYHRIARADAGFRKSRNQFPVFSEENDGSVVVNEHGKGFRLKVVQNNNNKLSVSEVSGTKEDFSGEYGSDASFVSSKGWILFNDPDAYSIFIPVEKSSTYLHSTPFLSALYINAEKIEPLRKYDGDVILRKVLSRTSSITLPHDKNFVTFEVTDPDFSLAHPQFYFKMEGIDRNWRRSGISDVKDRKLTTTYTALPPGDYTFRVRFSQDEKAKERAINITVCHPWWSTPLALVLYVVLTVMLLILGIRLYIRYAKRRIEMRQREEYLLSRIKHLIEEVDRYKQETPVSGNLTGTDEPEESKSLTDEDRDFVAKAIEMVERNLETPGYSVAQLSSDLCMDRTGLYRKLTSLLDLSPSLFIRNIRLQKAATLIKEGRLSIAEIAERCGFSTSSYMSKCFQERYGCKPSEFR